MNVLCPVVGTYTKSWIYEKAAQRPQWEPPPGEFYSFDSVEFPLGHVGFPKFGEYTMISQLDWVDIHRMLFRVSMAIPAIARITGVLDRLEMSRARLLW